MGVKQWLFQRTSNLVFVVFGIWFFISLLGGGFQSYETLAGLMNSLTAKFFLGIVLLLAVLNSVLAGWQIAGDYAHKINTSQSLIVGFVAVVSAAYLIVGGSLFF